MATTINIRPKNSNVAGEKTSSTFNLDHLFARDNKNITTTPLNKLIYQN